MARPYKCPYCQSSKTHWKGHRKRERDIVRLRKCNTCGKKWTTKKTLNNQL